MVIFLGTDYGALALNPVGSYLGGVQLKLTPEDITVYDNAGREIGKLCMCVCVFVYVCVCVCVCVWCDVVWCSVVWCGVVCAAVTVR